MLTLQKGSRTTLTWASTSLDETHTHTHRPDPQIVISWVHNKRKKPKSLGYKILLGEVKGLSC